MDLCELCSNAGEGVMQLASECQILAVTGYLHRHKNLPKILMVARGKEHWLIQPDTAWYKMKWKAGIVFENEKMKILWDFQYRVGKTATASRPDVRIQYKE